MTHLELWNSVTASDTSFHKTVSNGGYSFTAIDAYYSIRRATEQWGPMGEGWGLVGDVEIKTVGNRAFAFFNGRFWFDGKDESTFPVATSCEMIGTRRNGNEFMDEDAPKKVLTSAISKALSYLGFDADVFLGKHNDSAYVAPPQAASVPPSRPPQGRGHIGAETRAAAARMAGDPPGLDDQVGFGKHKALTWRTLAVTETDYLEWLLGSARTTPGKFQQANIAKYEGLTKWLDDQSAGLRDSPKPGDNSGQAEALAGEITAGFTGGEYEPGGSQDTPF